MQRYVENVCQINSNEELHSMLHQITDVTIVIHTNFRKIIRNSIFHQKSNQTNVYSGLENSQ